MRIKKLHLAVFFCLFQLSSASYADRHGYEQNDDHDGYEQDECRSSRGSCNSLASAQSSYSSSSRSGSGYENYSREGCSEGNHDSYESNRQESDHNSSTCAAPIQTSAAVSSSVNSRVADSSSRYESSYYEVETNDDQGFQYERSHDGGSGGGD